MICVRFATRTSESSQARFRLPSPLLPSQSSSAGRNINNGGGCDGAHYKIEGKGKEEEEEEEEKKKKKKKGRSVLLLHEDSGFASVRTRRVVGVDDSPHLFDYSSERHQ